MLHCIGNAVKQFSGRVQVHGQMLLPEVRRRRIGLFFPGRVQVPLVIVRLNHNLLDAHRYYYHNYSCNIALVCFLRFGSHYNSSVVGVALEVLPKALDRARRLLSLRANDAMLIEDWAPGHVSLLSHITSCVALRSVTGFVLAFM